MTKAGTCPAITATVSFVMTGETKPSRLGGHPAGTVWRRTCSAWPAVRRTLAGVVLAAWLGLDSFWIVTGDQPVCHVTTVTQSGSVTQTTVTRSCGLPDVSSYAYVLALAAVLMLPDAQRLKIGGVEFERLRTIADAAQVAQQVKSGDTPDDSHAAGDVISEVLGDDS